MSAALTLTEDVGSIPNPFSNYPKHGSGKWVERLASFGGLAKGWDSYRADPPSESSCLMARQFLTALEMSGLELSKLNPSVVGGVGFTFRSGQRSAYVEFRNTGNAHAAFIDGDSEPEVVKVETSDPGYAAVLAQIESFIHEQTS